MAEENPTPVRRGPARVHIYGSGIAGLTAAHELARRGFRVRVYESVREYDELGRPETGPFVPTDGQRDAAVGGKARSQYFRVAKGALGNFPGAGLLTTCDAYRFFYDYTGDWTGETWSLMPFTVFDFLNRRDLLPGSAFPGILVIHHPPRVQDERTPSRAATARGLHTALTGGFPSGILPMGASHVDPSRILLVDDAEQRFAEELGAPFPPLEDKDELLLEVVHFLPGEHGFRYIPAPCRHLLATMRETPLLDDAGQPTGRQLSDNLVPAGFHGVAAGGRHLRFHPRASAPSLFEATGRPWDPDPSGHSASDLRQLTLRTWRYLCTSPERRKAEYERISWREYLEGKRYSDAFQQDLWFAPENLTAPDAARVDARTQGNAFVQRYVGNLQPRPWTGSTLNGPTTPAWLRPWRRFLARHLRVEFIRGELTRLAFEGGRLVPYVTGTYEMGFGDWEEKPDTGAYVVFEYDKEPVDYYVVATDAFTAERVSATLPKVGVVQGLRGFTSKVRPEPREGGKAQRRQAGVLPGHVAWDRFQTLGGVQFFFATSVRLDEGCLAFLDTPWKLSAINSQQYWAAPPTLPRDGFISVLSVRIGDWHARAPERKSASECSPHELAHEVWRQLRTATERHGATSRGFALPEPAWYHVDRNLRFEREGPTGQERPVENRAPYLVPLPGDWERRPGPEPWNPMAGTTPAPPKEALAEGVWQAAHGGYPVHWGTLVFAGSYLKTFTRTTSMEAASESARHAVNAILAHCLAHHADSPRAAPPAPDSGGQAAPPAAPDVGMPPLTERHGAPPPREATGAGVAPPRGSPDFGMTPVGEYCRIWDPEQHEPSALAFLRELDARLFASGLPHVWDVLRLEPLAKSVLSRMDPSGDARTLESFADKAREALLTLANPLWPRLAEPSP